MCAVCCVDTVIRRKTGNTCVHTMPNASPSHHHEHITGNHGVPLTSSNTHVTLHEVRRILHIFNPFMAMLGISHVCPHICSLLLLFLRGGISLRKCGTSIEECICRLYNNMIASCNMYLAFHLFIIYLTTLSVAQTF